MDCRKYQELIGLALADALEEDKLRELRAHIDTCGECAAYEAEMQQLLCDLHGLDENVQAPPELLAGVKESIRRVSAPTREGDNNVSNKKKTFGPWKIVGVVAAALVVLVLGGTLVIGALSAVISGRGASANYAAKDSSAPQAAATTASSAKGIYPAAAEAAYDEGYWEDTVAAEEMEMPMPNEAPEAGASADQRENAAEAESTGEAYGIKIIRTADIYTESENFDQDMKWLQELIERMGGFVTSQELSGTALQPGESGYGRNLHLTIRVPSGRLDEFLKDSDGVGIVQYANVYEEDVTDRYYDTDRRLKAYQTQYDRILAMIEKAETVEELIQIETELNRINYEIESLTGSLKMWDSRVNYSTVQFSMTEVRRATPVNTTLGERMQNAMAQTLDNMALGGQNFIVWLYGALPVLGLLVVVFGVVALVIVLCVRRARKKNHSTLEK